MQANKIDNESHFCPYILEKPKARHEQYQSLSYQPQAAKGKHELALLWQILSGMGFPNQFFSDSWVVGFWRADHGWDGIGLDGGAWTLAEAVSGPARP
jgi:hypothetical protein